MAAQQEKLDNISNNIANVNTEGFKRTDVSFKDLVYETLNRKGYPNNGDGTLASINGTGVRTADWVRDNKQGNLTETGVKTDLAIDGKGYFRVVLPEKNADGTDKYAYMRNGGFTLDTEGKLVNSVGNRLDIAFNSDATAEEKMLTKDNFTVDLSGNINKKDGEQTKTVGRIRVYDVVSESSLKSIGNNLYITNPDNAADVPAPVEDVSIRQGYLELSNVDLSKEMTDMIMAQRAFELNSRAMKTADEMWGMANNLRGR
jgi:flagellar basal-body rod protein FlgG